jgi:hypothetical protein
MWPVCNNLIHLHTHALTRRVVDSVGAIIADINNEGSNLTLHFWETLSERVLGDAQFSIGQNNVMRLGLRRQAKTTVMSSHLKVPQRVMARLRCNVFGLGLPLISSSSPVCRCGVRGRLAILDSVAGVELSQEAVEAGEPQRGDGAGLRGTSLRRPGLHPAHIEGQQAQHFHGPRRQRCLYCHRHVRASLSHSLLPE